MQWTVLFGHWSKQANCKKIFIKKIKKLKFWIFDDTKTVLFL